MDRSSRYPICTEPGRHPERARDDRQSQGQLASSRASAVVCWRAVFVGRGSLDHARADRGRGRRRVDRDPQWRIPSWIGD